MHAQDDQDRAFDALFEPHGDGYLVFGKRGGALFSVQERDAYVAAHRKAKPGRKALPIITTVTLGVALIEFVTLNAALQWWPAFRSSADAVVAGVVAIALILPVALMGCLAYPSLSLISRVRREADRRAPLAPPRGTPAWTSRLPNLLAFVGVIGLSVAVVLGWATLTWPWILAGCGVAGLICYVVTRPGGR
ncbi:MULTISPECIES: hypothetical protein [Caulobacter]|uniref:hypothetical protein n=1 Tax=Caulobacter TaxID=75 RepID=UPI0006FC4497|nr:MULTISPECIES: hypothetical protein [Caulobacter]KQZ30851.1 hypothetical protein ASD47_18185 [Caulobacter sp. Root1472]GGL20029.1 hypothetical protein GCM10010983_16620 [Caulobacter rhizosphaerae]